MGSGIVQISRSLRSVQEWLVLTENLDQRHNDGMRGAMAPCSHRLISTHDWRCNVLLAKFGVLMAGGAILFVLACKA